MSKDNFSGKISQRTNRDKALYTSPLGTPVVADITLKGGTYQQSNGSMASFADVRLLTVLITCNRAKRIIKTQIEGREGTIKEYIGADDWQITINGTLTGGNGRYPTEETALLKAALDVSAPIPIISRYLQGLGIYDIVVTDYAFEQQPGGYSQQNFTVNCISDAVVFGTIS